MHHDQYDILTLAAGTWLACGIVLLGLTPLPWHDATWGWSPAFWLLAAPTLLLLVRRWRSLLPRRARAVQGSHPSRPARRMAVRHGNRRPSQARPARRMRAGT